MRTKLLATGVVVFVALLITAIPAFGQADEPFEVSGFSDATEDSLEAAGFGATVKYRIGVDVTVVVLYQGGPADPDLAARQVLETAWRLEPVPFDQLEVAPIEAQPKTFSYEDLAALLGPRPAGLEIANARDGVYGARAYAPVADLADTLIRALVLVVIVIGGGIFLIGVCIAVAGWAVAPKARARLEG